MGKTKSRILLLLILPVLLICQKTNLVAQVIMPDSTTFVFWEKPVQFSKTYYVDCNSKFASDLGNGTKEKPFKTINKAAQVLKSGERVIIASGVYRECVRPVLGGSDAFHLISYEAADGATVVVKGSIVVPNDKWQKSTGWYLNKGDQTQPTSDPKIWELEFEGNWFGGYNPFGMVNVLGDRYWLNYKLYNMDPYFRRRGMVFVDGKPLEQVNLYAELGDNFNRSLSVYSEIYSEPLFSEFAGENGKFWIENNGMKIHIRLKNDDDPSKHSIEIVTQEQVFAPKIHGLAYIRVKGITFEQAASGFPVPQRGLVSTSRGHHWIFENNTIQWANSVGLDVGKEDWNAIDPDTIGYHIIRGNTFRYCGIEGIGGPGPKNMLVEQNLFEWIGYQNAAEMAECAAMKCHFANNLLFRNNIIRHTRYADGVWLDINNINCRLTANLFADIGGKNCKADNGKIAIHIEGSIKPNMIDNNIFYNASPAIKIRDTDKLIVVNNLFANCPTGISSVCGLPIYSEKIEPRPIMGFTAMVRDNKVFNNIFANCSYAAIEFNNINNQADGNIYSGMPAQGSYLRILNPEPQEWLNLATWQEFHGFDKNGAIADIQVELDVDKLTMSLKSKKDLAKVKAFPNVTADYFNQNCEEKRIPGPFQIIGNEFIFKSIDPRKLNYY